MFARIRNALRARDATSRRLQAAHDFMVAAALLDVHEAVASGERDAARLANVYSAGRCKWAAADISALVPFVNDCTSAQIAAMFQHVADIDSGDAPLPATPPILDAGDANASAAFSLSIGPSTHTNPAQTLAFQMKSLYADEVAAASVRHRHMLEARHGHALWIGPSQAPTPEHTAGVYLRGRAAPGTVVALYAGVVYNGEMLRRPGDAGHLGNPALKRIIIPRFDEALIDATPGALEAAARRGNGSGCGCTDNPYALGIHVRHPPRGLLPNTMRIQVDFCGDEGGSGALLPFPRHLRPYIPNAWGADVNVGQQLYGALDASAGVWMKGMALLATRPLWDEELFVDAALNPNSVTGGQRLLPEWYTQLDATANARIWKGITS